MYSKGHVGIRQTTCPEIRSHEQLEDGRQVFGVLEALCQTSLVSKNSAEELVEVDREKVADSFSRPERLACSVSFSELRLGGQAVRP